MSDPQRQPVQQPTQQPMQQPHQQLSAVPHDRLHEHRRDEAWLAASWADPETRVLVVSGTRVRPRDGALEWVAPSKAPDGTRVLLGEVAGRVWWAVVADAGLSREQPDAWLPLRGLLPALAEAPVDHQAPLLLHALGIAEWLHVTRYCPRCARPLRPRSAGHELACDEGHVQFPRTDAAVIMLITHGEPGAPDERCLLGRHRVWPEARFSTLAGFYEPGETLEDAVRREVREEVGVDVGEVTWFGNQPWPLPASLMIGMTGRARSTDISVDHDEIAEARWLTRGEIAEQAASGEIVLPGGVSISRSLIETWYGASLPGHW